jgi:hypothetical protein
MNETTTAILITILGMLAAFSLAFILEPLKSYFLHKSQLNDLRVGLYREMWNNYFQCSSLIPSVEKGLEKDTRWIVELQIYMRMLPDPFHTEFYEYAINSELALFSKLPESPHLHGLYDSIDVLRVRSEARDKDEITRLAQYYCDNFAHEYYLGLLDQKCMRSIIHESELPELEERVKRVKKEDEENWVD